MDRLALSVNGSELHAAGPKSPGFHALKQSLSASMQGPGRKSLSGTSSTVGTAGSDS